MRKILLLVFSVCSIAQAQVFNWSSEVDPSYNNVSVHTTSPSGEVYLSKHTKNPSPSYYGTNDIVKYDTAGNEQWQYSIGGNARVQTMLYHEGTLFFSGVFRDSLRFNDSLITISSFLDLSFIVSIDSDGNFNWLTTPWTTKRAIYNLKQYDQTLYAVTIGSGWGSESIAEFDLNGNLQNEETFSGAVSISDFVFDDSDNIYISGYCNSGATFGNLTIPNTGSSYNSFILKTDANFNPIWLDAGPHITFDFEPKVYMVDDTLYYFHARKTPTHGATPYIFKYTQQGDLADSISFRNSWSPYYEHGWTKHNGEDVIVMLELKIAAEFGGFPLYFLDKNLSILRADTLSSLHISYTHFSASDEAICITGKANYGITYNSDTLLSFNGGDGNGIIHFSYDQDTTGNHLSTELISSNDLPVRLYPNPADDIITIQHELSSNLEVSIYTVTGAQVSSTIISGNSKTIDVSTLPAGYYILKAKAGDLEHVEKLIIQ